MATVPTPTQLGAIDTRIRFAHMEPDTQAHAFVNVGGDELDEFGYPTIGHMRLHDANEWQKVQRITEVDPAPSWQLNRALPAPVSYTERDRENRLIVPGGNADARAKVPRAMVAAEEFSEDENPLGPERFSVGKLALSAPYTQVEPWQYSQGQTWEYPAMIERVQPELLSDQMPPGELITEQGDLSQRAGDLIGGW